MTDDEQFKALTRPRGRPKIIRYENEPLKRAGKFEKVLIATKYYYRIEALRPEESDEWQAFSGVTMSKKRKRISFFDDHVKTEYKDLSYNFRLVITTVDRYRFICMFDGTCTHKEAGCVKRYISSHSQRHSRTQYVNLPLKEREVKVD